MQLKENEARKCPKCESIYSEKQKKCYSCDIQTEPMKMYSRLLYERLAFIGSTSVIAAIVYSIYKFITGTEFLFVEILVIALFSPVCIACIYLFAYILSTYAITYDIPSVGSLKISFPEGQIPEWANDNFSWVRYFIEAALFIGIIVFIAIVFVIFKLVVRT